MAGYRFPAAEGNEDGVFLGPDKRPETIEKVMSLEMIEGDVLIASYLKTGKTKLHFFCIHRDLFSTTKITNV
jgi:hypothetical protein